MKWKKNGSFSHHWTEDDSRVLTFLEETFKDKPIRPDYRCGYDYQVGDAKIEIKSCQEYIVAKGSNGPRRRGRFHFDKGTIADIIIFVIVRESGELEFGIRFPEQFGVRNLEGTKLIPWNKVFTEK